MPEDFNYDPEKSKLIYPAGKELYVKSKNFVSANGLGGTAYQAKMTDCRECKIRSKCMRNPRIYSRQIVKYTGLNPQHQRNIWMR